MIQDIDDEPRTTLEAQEAYWRTILAGELPVMQLCPDYPRPVVRTFLRARESIDLDATLFHRVRTFCAQTQVSSFVFLLAAFKALLLRHTGQEDIIVGSVTCDSRVSGSHSQPFTNVLALRTDLGGDPAVAALIGRVAETVSEAATRRDYPCAAAIEAIGSRRTGGISLLCQTMFTLCDASSDISERPVTRDDLADVEEHTNQCDLAVVVWGGSETLTVTCDYDAELFTATTMRRLLTRFAVMLQGIVADPSRRVSELPVLSETERRQLVVEWNATGLDYERDKCMHHLFEEQVRRTPDAIAVTYEDRELTYAELNARANQLARRLRKLGVGTEQLVAVCAERSLEMLIGLLGILKAGAAYVPLDPAYPAERIAFMLQDSRAALLLTQETLLRTDHLAPVAALSRHGDFKTLCLDADWQRIEEESSENLPHPVRPENLAYIIYTSGSTGVAKGVAIEHRNAVALLNWARSVFDRDDISGVLASTSICFDLSVFELFVPLSWGGTVVLVQNGLWLHRSANAAQVTLINTVPSVMAALLAQGALPASVRTVNLAGEPLTAQLAEQIYGLGTVAKLYDLYGPSETTTYSTVALRRANGPATIGRPIANTQIYLLDKHLQLVPAGVPGELYIGGDGVARGYLNRSELTAEKFIPDPFAPGRRLYRTGDLARYLADGNLEFLGRIDNQVKIRGFRVELGEIEAVLREHSKVRDAVVVAREDVPGEKRLVAYAVASGAAPRGIAPIAELRAYLQQRLPEFMIPSAFVFLDSFPLTPNGKIDRKALPRPEAAAAEAAAPLPPNTRLEQTIASIWREVLRAKQLGIYDNFFDLGGHSLLLANVHTKLERALRREVPFGELFHHPTINSLAKYLGDATEAPALPESVDRAEKQRRAFQTHRQRRLTPATGRARN
jgi:amino acid adenylation domain-containing protein